MSTDEYQYRVTGIEQATAASRKLRKSRLLENEA